MERISKMWRSGLAMLLALCLLVSACPVTVLAASNPVKYVSVGDSMTNGYGFVCYNQDGDHSSSYDFLAGKGVYGEGSYALQFEEYLAELYKDRGVVHTKLALSSLRAENLLYLLGINDNVEPVDGYDVYDAYVGGVSKPQLRKHYQTALSEADVITLALGNASFNAYFFERAMRVFGINGGFTSVDPKMTLDDALAMMESDTEKQMVRAAYDALMSELKKSIPAEMISQFKINDLCDLAAYTTASFALSYKAIIKWIGEHNPDAEVVLVGLMNSNAGTTVGGDGFSFDLGAAMEKVYSAISAYIGTLPAIMQATGECQNVKFYYAAQPSDPVMIASVVPQLIAADWGVVDRVDGPTVHKRTRVAFDGVIAPLVAPMLADVPASYHQKVYDIVFAGVEIAIAESLKSTEINLGALATFTAPNGMQDLFKTAPVDAVKAVLAATTAEAQAAAYNKAVAAFAEFFCSEKVLPLVRLFAMNLVGNGIAMHPTPATHDRIAANIIAAYGKNTIQDEIQKNMEVILPQLMGFLDNLDPESAGVLSGMVNLDKATTASLAVNEKSSYVVLGDGSAKSKGYAELVADKLGIKYVRNYAVTGNTVGDEVANIATRAGIADASLITIGFSNVTMLHNALRNAGVVTYDWEALVGAEMAPFVAEALGKLSPMIADMGLNESWTMRLNAIIEGFAYSAVEYALKLPELIGKIRTVNPNAVIVVVGQYNPMSGVVLDVGGASMDMSEYIDGLVSAVAAHGIGYALISGESIFVEAPKVDIANTKKVWTENDLVFDLLLNGFRDLYPSETGSKYIADQILGALKINETKPGSGFSDVAKNAYYYDAVEWAVEKGITKGTGDGTTFAPDAACTRAQIATFLWRAAGSPVPKSTAVPFKDVPAGAYYTTAVLWAAENGITTGTGDGTTFDPEGTCTRGQIVTMLCRYLKGSAAGAKNPFTDVPAGAYYTDAVLWAVNKGITTGTGNGTTFEPNATCTRGQIVTFLYRGLVK